jgi:hypothetical protein
VQIVADEYVHPEYSEDHVNVNCVLSWRRTDGVGGDHLFIDFQNGWVADSRAWTERIGAYESALAALKQNQAGKLLRLPGRWPADRQ